MSNLERLDRYFIVTQWEDEPHVVNAWNSYVNVTLGR